MQLPLWAVQLVRVDPWPREESADLWATGEDHTGQRWALRSTRGHRADAPLIEWFCYRLCDLLHIANPGYAVCQTSEGELVFGSRWADDAWQFAPHRHTVLQFDAVVRDAADDITRMLVLDAFLPNDDRHASNVLFRRVGQRWRALAFDWSRARWFEPWPWGQHCNSAQFAGWLRTMGRLQPAAAQDCAHAIQTIPTETVLESILAAPAPWRDNIDIDAVGNWWRNHAAERAEAAISVLGLPP